MRHVPRPRLWTLGDRHSAAGPFDACLPVEITRAEPELARVRWRADQLGLPDAAAHLVIGVGPERVERIVLTGPIRQAVGVRLTDLGVDVTDRHSLGLTVWFGGIQTRAL